MTGEAKPPYSLHRAAQHIRLFIYNDAYGRLRVLTIPSSLGPLCLMLADTPSPHGSGAALASAGTLSEGFERSVTSPLQPRRLRPMGRTVRSILLLRQSLEQFTGRDIPIYLTLVIKGPSFLEKFEQRTQNVLQRGASYNVPHSSHVDSKCVSRGLGQSQAVGRRRAGSSVDHLSWKRKSETYVLQSSSSETALSGSYGQTVAPCCS
jgi:hypothetical protein